MEFPNVVITILLAITGYFLKGVADAVQRGEVERHNHALRLENHEGRIVGLEDSR